MDLLDCKGCGTQFSAGRRKRKFCSRACLSRSQSRGENFHAVVRMKAEGLTAIQIASRLGVSRTRVYQLLEMAK